MILMKTVEQIIKNKIQFTKRSENESLCIVGPVELPIKQEGLATTFDWYSWINIGADHQTEEVLSDIQSMNLARKQQSSVLVFGDFANSDKALIRMHSICHTGDIFGSQRCDCGYQLHESMKMIVEHGCGAIFYIADHEGRGIGLFSKSIAYLLQEEGYDTVQANEALGFEDDIRSYEDAIIVLKALREKPVVLITNNPKKLSALQKHGLLADEHIPLWGGKTERNEQYLQTKIEKSGHIL